MQNLKLIIAYDGKEYLGWQKTRMGLSIEETLKLVLEKILQHPLSLQAASRTDAGVHALGQVVNFLTSKQHLDLEKFQASLNHLLPKDIVVLNAKWMPTSFHPTLNCLSKEYRYYICNGLVQLPQHRFYSWHIPNPLDFQSMKQACDHFLGTHDFASFCNAKKNAHYSDYIRTVERLEIHQIEDQRFSFHIQGNHFLYKMARNIVGTLIDIGRNKIELKDLSKIIEQSYRPAAGVTAPAHGLFLHKVNY